MFAVSAAVVQSAAASPDDLFTTLADPGTAAIESPAFPADKPVAEGVPGCIAGEPGRSRPFVGGAAGTSTCKLRLGRLISFPADDSFVVVLNKVHGKLSHILDNLPADAVADKCLLQQHVPAVLLIF